MENQFHEETKDKVAFVQQIVDVVRLDELHLKPDIIKIDTEGHDYQALLGMTQTIKSCRPVVMIEHNPDLLDEELAFFQGMDYQFLVYGFKTDRFDTFDRAKELEAFNRTKVSKNIFCIPKEKAVAL